EQTQTGRGTLPLVPSALNHAEGSLENLHRVNILLRGTGQIGMIIMKALKARGMTDVTVASRTRQRTESFCRTFGGKPADIKNVTSQLGLFGLVVVATRATGYLLTKEIVVPQLKSDQDPKLMILDLSIPRNVSPDLEQLKSVVIKTIDDLRDITDQAVS